MPIVLATSQIFLRQYEWSYNLTARFRVVAGAGSIKTRGYGEWQKLGALRRELDCLLTEAAVQHRGPDLKHAVGAPR